MPGYARLYPLMRGDVRSLRLPGRFGTVYRGESGPTPRLSRAAERAVMQRHGNVKENMFVNRGWRRRLQAYVGPGHGRRRAFGMPNRGHGRDTDVAESDSDVTIRDIATGPTARDPATGHRGPTAHDPAAGHPACTGPYTGRRARRRTRPHAMTIPDAMPGDEPYGTRRPSSSPGPATGDTARDDHLVPDDVW